MPRKNTYTPLEIKDLSAIEDQSHSTNPNTPQQSLDLSTSRIFKKEAVLSPLKADLEQKVAQQKQEREERLARYKKMKQQSASNAHGTSLRYDEIIENRLGKTFEEMQKIFLKEERKKPIDASFGSGDDSKEYGSGSRSYLGKCLETGKKVGNSTDSIKSSTVPNPRIPTDPFNNRSWITEDTKKNGKAIIAPLPYNTSTKDLATSARLNLAQRGSTGLNPYNTSSNSGRRSFPAANPSRSNADLLLGEVTRGR